MYVTHHQSQLKICCWKRVPLGQRKEVGYMLPASGSSRHTWYAWQPRSTSA